jgi:tyrosine-protein phosphatase YwqE
MLQKMGFCLLQGGQPVSFGSRALSEQEKEWAQTEKEMLSIVEVCKKFHNLIYGLKVNVQTDHKPLVSLFQKPISKIGSSRLQRLRLKVLKYALDVQYIPGKQMYVADLLSRDYIKKTNA